MKYLVEFIEDQNFYRRHTEEPLLDIKNLSQKDVKELAEALSSKLSPENLFQDGERSHSVAKQYYQFYLKVIRDLEKIGHPFTIADL